MISSEIKGKVAYIRGLAEGLKIDQAGDTGRLMMAVVDALETVARGMERLEVEHDDIEEYLGAMDEDLTDLEDDYYADEGELTVDVDDDEEYVSVECENCGESVYFDESLLLDNEALEITCPNCGEVVYDTEQEYQIIQDDDGLNAVEELNLTREHKGE
ncbi:MAG: CD1247 N-terminal domain-containing protein [Bacillota bacterium]